MKVQDLHLCDIRTPVPQDTSEIRVSLLYKGLAPVDIWSGEEYFESVAEAAKAAARFRASEVMYQALDRAETLLDNLLKDGIDYEGVRRGLAEISAALALAENTTEQVEITEP